MNTGSYLSQPATESLGGRALPAAAGTYKHKSKMQHIKFIEGGVTAPKGFTANGVHCGIRKGGRLDLALIKSEVEAVAAGVFTTNKVKGAPVILCQRHLKNSRAQAVIVNSGKANTCAPGGMEAAKKMAALVAGVKPQNVLVASTGVIGQPLPVHLIEQAAPALYGGLSRDGGDLAAQAILTTDLVKKVCAVEFSLGGKTCRIGGIAKGSGMININMATMLAFITTDVYISAGMLKAALKTACADTFNMVSVDGDTSTNDTLTILANGLAGNTEITETGADFSIFVTALSSLCRDLSRKIAADGEGATKLIECTVEAGTLKDARLAAKAVVNSSLVKAAMFGKDANWGRILAAVGYSGAKFNPDEVEVEMSAGTKKVLVCKHGAGVEFSEEAALGILNQSEVAVFVKLGRGGNVATAWGCDLTYDYVKINGDYRT